MKCQHKHPGAKMLVEVSKTQDDEVGDGTTTAVLLSGELLEKAEKLLDKDVHPTVIVDGYKKAAEKAIEILDKLSFPVTDKDDATLRHVAMTSMYSKGIVIDKEISHAQMPKKIELAKIALLNAKLENEKTEFDAKININNPDQMHLFIEEEEKMLKDMVSQIEKTGANVVFSEKGIDDVALHFL